MGTVTRERVVSKAILCEACTHGEQDAALAVSRVIGLPAQELGKQLAILSRKAPAGQREDVAQSICALWLDKRPSNLGLSWAIGKGDGVAQAWRSQWEYNHAQSGSHAGQRARKLADLEQAYAAEPDARVAAGLRRQIVALQVREVESLEAIREQETAKDVAAAVEWQAHTEGEIAAVSIWQRLPVNIRAIVHKRLLGTVSAPAERTGGRGRPRTVYALDAQERKALSRWVSTPEARSLLLASR